MTDSKDELMAQLNKETAKLDWKELERHFARGSVIRVEPGKDLIEVAVLFAEDDAKSIESLLSEGVVANASTEDAKLWNECQSEFWAVVVAPFVLVQEIKPRLNS